MRKSRDDRIASTAQRYREFARWAGDRPPRYAELANAVAEDDEVLAFVSALPSTKRQPNLVFSVAEDLLGHPVDIDSLRGLLSERRREFAQALLRSKAER